MRFYVTQTADVQIDILDGSDAITRVTGPNGDEWRRDLYRLHTVADVLEMWADNAVRNGVRNPGTLDGWADLEEGEVTVPVTFSRLEDYDGPR